MDALYVIATIAGERVALRAQDVEAVVEAGAVTPVPNAMAHVAGIAALRSRVLTVIDARAALGLPEDGLQSALMLVCPSGGHVYGILIGAVEDVVTVEAPMAAAPGRLAHGWSRAAAGIVEVEGVAILVVDVEALIRGPEPRDAGDRLTNSLPSPI
jgi:purine-binding chemotaxis protein CheW